MEVAPAPAYSLRVVEYAPTKLPVLVLYRDGATGELDVAALDDDDVVAPVAPFQLVGLVLDVDHVSRRVGQLSLYPLPELPAAR
jgi:hypothetical protein